MLRMNLIHYALIGALILCSLNSMANGATTCKWSEWMDGPCSVECGDGKMTRTRTCECPDGFDYPDCQGKDTEKAPCNLGDCEPVCEWGEWMDGPCSVECGDGELTRTRSCECTPHSDYPNCEGEDSETVPCSLGACAPVCAWSEWKDGTCSEECGDGELTRTRTCDCSREDDIPNCEGEDSETVPCNLGDCEPVCAWSEWKDGTCSKECGDGELTRTRTCDCSREDDIPNCEGEDSETVPCNLGPCESNCKWGDWKNKGKCSKPCGGGEQKRTRKCTCDNGKGKFKEVKDSSKCKDGLAEETQPCNTQACCSWDETSFEEWGECKGGVRVRYAKCTCDYGDSGDGSSKPKGDDDDDGKGKGDDDDDGKGKGKGKGKDLCNGGKLPNGEPCPLTCTGHQPFEEEPCY